jgi:uncharacterized membrane protein YjdF
MLADYADRAETAMKDPIASSDRVCHVLYSDFVADQVGTIGRIYAHFGLNPAGIDLAVQSWLGDAANRSDRHGKWSYDLADFGVTEDEVRDRFRTYSDHFGV